MPSPLLFVGPIDRVLFLQSVPVYRDLGVGYLAAIAQHGHERFLRPGTAWHAAGEPLTSAAFVVQGSLTVDARDGTSAEHSGPGEAVGLLQLLAGEGRGLTVHADVPTLLLEVPWEAQLDLCEEHFAVLDQYLRYLARYEDRRAARSILGRARRHMMPSGRPLDFVERLEALASAAVLPAHGLDALTELAHHVTELRLTPERELWAAGDEAESFVLVLEGEIVEGGGANRTAVGPGDVVGMAAALGRRPRAAPARPPSPGVGLSIELEAFLDILEDHFDVAIELLALRAREILAGSPEVSPGR